MEEEWKRKQGTKPALLWGTTGYERVMVGLVARSTDGRKGRGGLSAAPAAWKLRSK